MIKQFEIVSREYETLSFEMFGKEYTFQKRVPAGVALLMAEHEHFEEVTLGMLAKMGRMIFGNEILDDLCSHPEFTMDVFGDLVLWGISAITE